MYTILMNDDKQLIQSKRSTIYQKETNVDKIRFLFPQTYEDLDLSKYIIVLKYRDLENEPRAEFLELKSELYKGRLQSIYKLTSDFTRFACDINVHISFVLYNPETESYDEVLHTGDTTITIHPTDIFNGDYSDDYTDEEVDLLGKLILDNKAQIEANKSMLASLEENQVDDLVVTDDTLQVSSNGKAKGNGVSVSTFVGNPAKLSNLEIENILREGGL